ncbi:hypothetical protein [Actinoalloteichus caeruleus]|uniref:hypothetical protein n=1 Tax=Actinoalloteichus cyanogriseus TaxID=2893586 RepID=UPI00200FD36B|nr:hypothetical protein [Actinoalloteichus caeruleus]
MLAAAQNPPSPEGTHHPMDAYVPDPRGMEPICDEAEFTALVRGMVDDEAPRLFAVVQEYGDRVDAQIAAWGMVFGDRAEIVLLDDGTRVSATTPESALRGFHLGPHIRARLVWCAPHTATRPG